MGNARTGSFAYGGTAARCTAAALAVAATQAAAAAAARACCCVSSAPRLWKKSEGGDWRRCGDGAFPSAAAEVPATRTFGSGSTIAGSVITSTARLAARGSNGKPATPAAPPSPPAARRGGVRRLCTRCGMREAPRAAKRWRVRTTATSFPARSRIFSVAAVNGLATPLSATSHTARPSSTPLPATDAGAPGGSRRSTSSSCSLTAPAGWPPLGHSRRHDLPRAKASDWPLVTECCSAGRSSTVGKSCSRKSRAGRTASTWRSLTSSQKMEREASDMFSRKRAVEPARQLAAGQ